MPKTLFEGFNEVSSKEWKQKIQADLKGEDYENLIFHSREGIDVKPFYHLDDFTEREISATPEKWQVIEKFEIDDTDKGITAIKHALSKGTEALWLQLTADDIDLKKLFNSFDIAQIPVFVESNNSFTEENLAELGRILENKKHQVSLGVDIIGHLAASGNWHKNLKADFKTLETAVSYQKTFPQILSINTAVYQNAGATIVQELAYSLAHVNEYLNYLHQNKPEALQNFKPTFKVACGSNYFFEIAKLRALRNLYASIAQAYSAPEAIKILAFPTLRNKTLYDYNVNLLRTTTECMSAILGGADYVCNIAYDSFYHKKNEFGTRIARNQLLILKEESYFNKVSNISDGSYYIEELTQKLSEKALKIFKDIEKGGGYLKQLKEGIIQRKISESAKKEENSFKEANKVLVGTNKYKNEEDKMATEIEIDPFLKVEKRRTLLQPIIQKRLAESLERKRLAEEEN